MVPFYCMHSGITNAFCVNQGYFRVYAWPVVCIAQMASMWLVVLISSERYVAIIHPLKAVRMRNVPRVQRAILVVFAGAILFNIPKFFEFKPEKEFHKGLNITFVVVNDTQLRVNTVYRYLYNTALYCLVVYAIPMPLLTFLNVRIVRQISAAINSGIISIALNRKKSKRPSCLCVLFWYISSAVRSPYWPSYWTLSL